MGVVIFWALFFWTQWENVSLKKTISRLTPSSEVIVNSPKAEDCKVTNIEYGVSGNSMTPLIKDGQKVKVLDNYYQCTGKVERGDIIIYESFTTPGPIIKQVRVLSGDIVKFEKWKMVVNGTVLKNSVEDEYVFSEKEVQYMSMYLEDSRMQTGSFFAFGDNTVNSVDSRTMGGLGIDKFKGKVVLDVK